MWIFCDAEKFLLVISDILTGICPMMFFHHSSALSHVLMHCHGKQGRALLTEETKKEKENDLSLVMQLANLSVIHLIKETGQQLHPSLKFTSREILIYLVNNRMFCLLKELHLFPPTHTLFFKPPLKQMLRNFLHIWRHNYCSALQS